MPSKKPVTYKQINWFVFPFIMGILYVLAIIGYATGGVYGLLAVIVLFVGYAQASRRTILKDYYQGMKRFRAEAYPDAVSSFRECADFLGDHQWIDRYRSVILLSASAISFREMCLCNAAYTLVRNKKIDEAIRAYDEILVEFPESVLASTSLENINLIRDAVKRDAVVNV